MNDAEKRWNKYPEIGFEHRRILTVDHHAIELSDITGEMLADYIEIGREQIDTQIEVLKQLRRYRNNSEMNPHLLIGRLAVSEFEERALTLEGTTIVDDLEIQEEHLQHSYRVFWHLIDAALYKPVVHRHLLEDYPSLRGTWLGLTKY